MRKLTMLWQTLLSTPSTLTLPWTGGRALHGQGRVFELHGRQPAELGWHRFAIDGSRKATWQGEAPCAELEFIEGLALVRGYLVGDRLVPDGVTVRLDAAALLAQSERVWLVERGLDRFARVVAARLPDGRLVYVEQAFPLGPEPDVLDAWQDERESLDGVAGVTPALHLAFLCQTHQRREVAERRARLEAAAQAAAEAEARQRRWRAAVGSAAERRKLVTHDFEAAARAALSVSGSRLLDVREAHRKGEAIVQFAFGRRRFECVVERSTLRIIDAGICLENHATGERGDTYFTLESLPAVIAEAERTHRLVVWRHVDG